VATEDSGPVPLDVKSRRRVHFDPTINLGHVLTFLVMVASIMGVYSTVNSQLAVHGVRLDAIEKAAIVEKAHLADTLNGLREDVKETKRAIERDQREPRR
jgi:uncharacterized membrane protein (DUF106 family)